VSAQSAREAHLCTVAQAQVAEAGEETKPQHRQVPQVAHPSPTQKEEAQQAERQVPTALMVQMATVTPPKAQVLALAEATTQAREAQAAKEAVPAQPEPAEAQAPPPEVRAATADAAKSEYGCGSKWQSKSQLPSGRYQAETTASSRTGDHVHSLDATSTEATHTARLNEPPA
jgi:hypothetical protein